MNYTIIRATTLRDVERWSTNKEIEVHICKIKTDCSCTSIKHNVYHYMYM